MKKIIAIITIMALLTGILSGCNVKTKQTEKVATVSPEIILLTRDIHEQYANVVRDQLAKAGFSPKIVIQPDFASFKSAIDSGSYDLAVHSWTTMTGSPDYAVRGVWRSDGAFNFFRVNDPEIDRLIDLGATQSEDEYMDTYLEYEKYMIEEKAYVIPLYVTIKNLAFNKEIMDADSIHISKSRSMVWESLSFLNKDDNDKKPFIMSQSLSDLTPLDPIRADDSSTSMLIVNSYIRLMNLTDDDKLTNDSTLAYDYAIAENGQDFYFLLRDDVNFSKVENFTAVDSGERVGAEDVVFSLDRMRTKECVPDHMAYDSYESIEKTGIITNVEDLKNVKTKNGISVLESFEKNAPTKISSLVEDKTKADNKQGVYQVVTMSTRYAFPQILNLLAYSSGGIVSKSQLEKISHYDPATYDVKKDVLYGEQVTYAEGPEYNNTLYCSGPYIPIKKNDTEVIFEKNPGYMPTTEFAPKIKEFQMKFIKAAESSLAALRSGEIYLRYSIPESMIEVIKEDGKFGFKEISGNMFTYCGFNLEGQFGNEDLRKAALYAINQEELSAVFNNRLLPTYTAVTSVLQTKNAHKGDLKKSAEYLQKYADSLGK